MYQLERARMAFLQVDTCDTAIVYLSEELAEIRAALMPYPCVWKELWLVACLHDTVAEVDVLAEAHLRETAQLLVDIPADTHIEGTGIELVEFLLASPYSPCSEKGGHRVGDGFLHGSKRGVRSVGTAPTC